MTDDERKKVFSTNLNKFLNMYSKSQIDVARAIGVSQQTFNTWCRGVAIPRMGKIQLLADYFKIDMAELITKEGLAASAEPTDACKARLLRYYELLNEEGRKRLLEQAKFFASQDEYKEIKTGEDVG